jgi:hypothetical protein
VSTAQPPVPRATRFAMNLPVRYRTPGEARWSYGMTINISSTGVLFRAGRALPPRAAMDIEVVLPGDEEGSARVVGRGSVTRSAADASGDDHIVAATLDGSDLVRTER